MTVRSPKASRRPRPTEPPEARRWRDIAFWSLILVCLAAFLVLSALDDRPLLLHLAVLTTHGKVDRIENFQQIALVAENVRWWILALPLAALFLRWVPYSPPQSPKKNSDSGTGGLGVPPKILPPSNPGRGSQNTPDGKTIPNRTSPLFPCPPFVVGLFALQLCIGAGFLTGTWTYVRDRFWFPVPKSPDQIRSEFMPHSVVPISRRLARILPPDAKVYIVTDPGETPVFLNYYLYPRRLYSSETGTAFVKDTDTPSFWQKRRKEGYRWVYIYRPQADPIGGGQLIELPPFPKVPKNPGEAAGWEEGTHAP